MQELMRALRVSYEQPWKRGHITPGMSAKAAIVANTAIMRMMRCDG